MRSISWYVRVTVLLLATGLIWACGNEPEDTVAEEGVHAINLETGESREFDAVARVPAGWAVCEGSDCTTIPSRFRCNMMGPGACLLNGACRLRLRCDIDIPLWLRPAADASAGGGDGQQGDPLPTEATGSAGVEGGVGQAGYPVGCELVCSPKKKLSCDEIENPNQCEAQPECQVDTICRGDYYATDAGEAPAEAAPLCRPDDASCLVAPVPPPATVVCTKVCRDRAAPACEELDRYACARRDDCTWLLDPVPLFEPAEADVCSGAACELPYRSFCRPKIEPVCPPVRLAMPVCKEGQELVKELDENGCVVGYKCVPFACPPVPLLHPVCQDGEVPLEKIDERGCVIGVRCEPVDCPGEVKKPICPLDSGDPEPVVKDGCIVDYTCGPVCPPVPPKPQPCQGKLTGLYSGSCLMGWSCSEPLDTTACRQLAADYSETLQAAKRCVGDTGGTGGTVGGPEQDFAAPAPWLGTCSTTVMGSLGCGCPTYVNPANREALAKLNEIRAAFEKGQCFREWACAAVMCYAPSGATCVTDSSGGNGVCKDNNGPTPL